MPLTPLTIIINHTCKYLVKVHKLLEVQLYYYQKNTLDQTSTLHVPFITFSTLAFMPYIFPITLFNNLLVYITFIPNPLKIISALKRSCPVKFGPSAKVVWANQICQQKQSYPDKLCCHNQSALDILVRLFFIQCSHSVKV